MNEELIFVKDFVINTINDTNYWLKHEDSLKRRVIVECRVNLALLDMAMWKDVTNQFKYYLIGQLQTEAIELAIESSTENIFSTLNDFISSGDRKKDSGYAYSIIISKMKALKVIANIPEELSDDNKSRLNSRIKNLKEHVHSLLVKLETK
jgi:hypothetical protein